MTKVLAVVEENHSLAEMRAGMPYLYGLAQRYGFATDYHAVTHPSLPNYLAIVGGSTFGVTDDAAPSVHPVAGASVFGEAVARGHTARLYAEDLPAPCATEPAGGYAVKHAPWAYFVDERTACRTGMVPAGTPTRGTLANDIHTGHLPTVGMLIPDLVHDAHNAGLGAADQWLRGWLERLMAGPDFASGRLAIVVTADEDDRSDTNRVLTVVIAPGVNHRVVRLPLTHYSLTKLYAEVAGARPLRDTGSATSLGDAFGLRIGR